MDRDIAPRGLSGLNSSVFSSRGSKDSGGLRAVTVSFDVDTPNIKYSEGGIEFFTPVPGESLSYDSPPMLIRCPTTVFDDPDGQDYMPVYSEGDDPADAANVLLSGGVPHDLDLPVGTHAVAVNAFAYPYVPTVFTDATPVKVCLGFGSPVTEDAHSTVGAVTLIAFLFKTS